jgi:hypothetical protein
MNHDEWDWNPETAQSGHVYEILTAEYCSLYKRVLVHRNFGFVDASRIWRYTGQNATMVEFGGNRVMAFRAGAASAEDTARAVAAFEVTP